MVVQAAPGETWTTAAFAGAAERGGVGGTSLRHPFPGGRSRAPSCRGSGAGTQPPVRGGTAGLPGAGRRWGGFRPFERRL